MNMCSEMTCGRAGNDKVTENITRFVVGRAEEETERGVPRTIKVSKQALGRNIDSVWRKLCEWHVLGNAWAVLRRIGLLARHAEGVLGRSKHSHGYLVAHDHVETSKLGKHANCNKTLVTWWCPSTKNACALSSGPAAKPPIWHALTACCD